MAPGNGTMRYLDRDVVSSTEGSWSSELWLIARYSPPLIATYLLHYSCSDSLAAASLGITAMNIAYDAGNRFGVGLHVQRMLLSMAVVAIPIGAVWAASPRILSLFVKQRDLAIMAGPFLRINIVGICAPTNNLRLVLLLLYTMSPAGRWSLCCWGGFSRAAISPSKGGPMVRMSAAGSAVNLTEWTAPEIVAFSTSYLSTEQYIFLAISSLATQSVLTTISAISWHIPFSLSISSIPPVAINMASKAMPCVRVFRVVDAFTSSSNGMLRGLGRQAVAAWVATITYYYCAAVPFAICLELGPSGLGLDGGAYMKMSRWQDCVDRVKLREGRG
ncbi:MATE efflux family protein [Xylaria sp. CBS 124048]|nr:MATE efflux family protein [Xylaria sp. CBS 124048]